MAFTHLDPGSDEYRSRCHPSPLGGVTVPLEGAALTAKLPDSFMLFCGACGEEFLAIVHHNLCAKCRVVLAHADDAQ